MTTPFPHDDDYDPELDREPGDDEPTDAQRARARARADYDNAVDRGNRDFA
jgi:hypothetical protein